MRQSLELNSGWLFRKGEARAQTALQADWEQVTLPHTWNAADGQDGGNDYYRGYGCYARRIGRAQLPDAAKYMLEIRGANSTADVYLDGEPIAHHDGGLTVLLDRDGKPVVTPVEE